MIKVHLWPLAMNETLKDNKNYLTAFAGLTKLRLWRHTSALLPSMELERKTTTSLTMYWASKDFANKDFLLFSCALQPTPMLSTRTKIFPLPWISCSAKHKCWVVNGSQLILASNRYLKHLCNYPIIISCFQAWLKVLIITPWKTYMPEDPKSQKIVPPM